MRKGGGRGGGVDGGRGAGSNYRLSGVHYSVGLWASASSSGLKHSMGH